MDMDWTHLTKKDHLPSPSMDTTRENGKGENKADTEKCSLKRNRHWWNTIQQL